jgi:hypothetical protein
MPRHQRLVSEPSYIEEPSTEDASEKGWFTRRRIMLLIVVGIVAAIIITVAVFGVLSTREISRDVTVHNADGDTGTAFVVIRPGIGSTQDDVTDGMIEGLVKADWRVESTSSHKGTPTNVSGHDMFVFGTPTYGSRPHGTLLDWLKRVDLEGKPVVLLVTSGGEEGGKAAADVLREAVEDANGKVIDELVLTTGDGSAVDKARDLGKDYTSIPE